MKILVYVPETYNIIVYDVKVKGNIISCPICGRWYANYYIGEHLRRIHNKYIIRMVD